MLGVGGRGVGENFIKLSGIYKLHWLGLGNFDLLKEKCMKENNIL